MAHGDGDRGRRAASFADVAVGYELARPDYPQDMIAWTLGSAVRVLDLGAGTGKLTRGLVALGYESIAVEPLPEMLAELLRAVPEAEAIVGNAEAIPLPDDSVDAVIVAQAFHWFDAPVALREIARVLKPGGSLGLLWNIPREDAELVRRLSPIAGGLPSQPPEIAEPINQSGLFEPLQESSLPHQQILRREEMLLLAASWSHLASMSEGERADALAGVGKVFDQLSQSDQIAFPYVTYAFRTRRIAGI